MNPFKKPMHMALLVFAALQLTACSRTVQWKEEVPLNTGETIFVERSGTYTYRCEFAAGTGCGFSPNWRSTIEFTYKGKKYSHTDAAGLILLAIAPDGIPNLVAMAGEYDWQWKNNYHCVVPFYVQFRPDATGKNWNWPQQIDPWLYSLRTNLIFGLAPLSFEQKKYTVADRTSKNGSLLIFREYQQIDPTYKYETCKGKN